MDCSKDGLYQSYLGFLVLIAGTSRAYYEKYGNDDISDTDSESDYSDEDEDEDEDEEEELQL